MIRIITLTVISLLIFGCSKLKTSNHGDNSDTRLKYQLDSVFSELNKDGLFNGELLVAQDHKVLIHKYYGKADLVQGQDFNENSVFEIASISKPFTALAICKLISDNKLSYEDSVVKFLPEFRYPAITIKQLLSHTSGLPDYYHVFYPNWDHNKIANNHDLFKILEDKRPELISEPGQEWKYSNIGYTVLAILIERLTGETYNEYCRKSIFEPLNMENTIVPDYKTSIELKNYVNDYVFYFGEAKYIDPKVWPSFDNATFTADMYGAQGICTNATDLFKFSLFLNHNNLIQDPVFRDYITPVGLETPLSKDFTLGWFYDVDEILGKTWFSSGGFSGYRSFFQYFPESKTTIVLLSNTSTTSVWKLKRLIIDILNGNEFDYPKKSYIRELCFQLQNIPSDQLNAYKLTDLDTLTMEFKEYEMDELVEDLMLLKEYDKAKVSLEKIIEIFPDNDKYINKLMQINI